MILSFTINNGATWTNTLSVALQIYATDNQTLQQNLQMRFSNDNTNFYVRCPAGYVSGVSVNHLAVGVEIKKRGADVAYLTA